MPDRPVTRLAPREIADLVYRCGRVTGVDAGNARRCGSNVTHGEIHRGRSVQAFVDALADDETAVMAFAMASLSIDIAEADEQPAIFDKPTAVAAISAALWHAALRGYDSTTSDDTGSAHELLTTVDFCASTLSSHRQQEAREREQHAMRQGVSVDSELVQQLTRYASGFLVSELIVDAVVDATD